MTDGKREIISRLIEEYDIKTAEDIQDALDVYKRQVYKLKHLSGLLCDSQILTSCAAKIKQ